MSKFADKDGFDIRNIEKNKKYKIEIELPYGTILIRYGNETGRFSAPKGTKYEDLALPYVKNTVEYNEYKVIATGIKVICVVEKGNKFNLKQYRNLMDTCYDLISRVSESEKEKKEIQNIFKQKIYNEHISPELQILNLTKRINKYNEIAKLYPNDYESKRKLLKLTSQRQKLLANLRKIDKKKI